MKYKVAFYERMFVKNDLCEYQSFEYLFENSETFVYEKAVHTRHATIRIDSKLLLATIISNIELLFMKRFIIF